MMYSGSSNKYMKSQNSFIKELMRCIYIECSPVDDSGHIHVRSSTDNVLLAKPLTAVQLKIKKHFVIYQCINDQK